MKKYLKRKLEGSDRRDDTSKIIGDAIGKIPSNNTNPMRFATDLAAGRNKVADSVKIDPINGSKIGARVGVAMAA